MEDVVNPVAYYQFRHYLNQISESVDEIFGAPGRAVDRLGDCSAWGGVPTYDITSGDAFEPPFTFDVGCLFTGTPDPYIRWLKEPAVANPSPESPLSFQNSAGDSRISTLEEGALLCHPPKEKVCRMPNVFLEAACLSFSHRLQTTYGLGAYLNNPHLFPFLARK